MFMKIAQKYPAPAFSGWKILTTDPTFPFKRHQDSGLNYWYGSQSLPQLALGPGIVFNGEQEFVKKHSLKLSGLYAYLEKNVWRVF